MVNITPELVGDIVRQTLNGIELANIPIGISNRHVHLTEEHFHQLFPGEELQPIRKLKQAGEFAAEQTVTVVGQKGMQERVRILGPFRKQSQVELSMTDARYLGIPATVCLSGNLNNAADVTLRNGNNEITIKGAIVAKRHIHMSFKDAERFRLSEDASLKVRIVTEGRTTIFEDVGLRFGENYILEMHIDTDEANSAGVKHETVACLIRD